VIAISGKTGGERGGIHRYVGAVTHELDDRRFPYSLIGGTNGGRIHRFRSTLSSARRVLSDRSIDLVATHFALDAFPVILQRRKQVLVCHHHGPWTLESMCESLNPAKLFFKYCLERFVYGNASLVITLSEAFRNSAHANYGIPYDRIRVIPGGVDTNRFSTSLSRAEARARLVWPTDRPIIVAVRRLVKRMGLPILIDAISRIRRWHPDVFVVICGHGPLRAQLASQVRALGLEDSVLLKGYLDEQNLPLAYRAADLSVVPSIKYEGFGLAAVESLASGTPTLASNLDGLPEILQPLSPNLLVTPKSTPELADRISQILRGRVQIPSELACRDYAVQRYAWPLIVDRILGVYAEARQLPRPSVWPRRDRWSVLREPVNLAHRCFRIANALQRLP
jgi:glycosyltransferase involved in cell wall biosynthesis